MTELKSMRDEFTNKSNKLQKLALLNKYEADRLEQYSRRESIRISGIPDSVNDDTNSLSHFVIQVGKVLKVEIARGDISAIHRVGKFVRGSKPTLVNFISRQPKEC